MSQHGTISAYCNGGCRCGECRAAWAAYFRDNGINKRRRARLVAAGLTTNGTEPKRRRDG